MKSLLLIACSTRKAKSNKLIPALERYDGGTYRVIRKLQREGAFPKGVDVRILSAKFGLIDASTPIPYYDQRINKSRAQELNPTVVEELRNCIAQDQYSEIYMDLGKDYLPAINGFIVPSKIKLSIAQGRIGERLSRVKNWLMQK